MQKNILTLTQVKEKIDYQRELNTEQIAVVTHGDGPCVVLAGAGSGKTRTIVYRVAYLLERGVRPERILLLTFTNKAANEMMSRIQTLSGIAGGTSPLWGGTFHSIANRILRSYSDRIGFTRSFSILDEDDSKSLIKACLRELGIDCTAKRFPSPAIVKELISFGVNAMLPFEKVLQKKNPKLEPHLSELRRVVELYDQKKRAANVMDFDDLLVRLHTLLVNDQTMRDELAEHFEYILVDEYQDTNPLQASIVHLFSGTRKNLLVVGDDAQSIYSFRAADIKNILDFPKHYPDAKIFKLEINYRSTPEILTLANDVIAKNTLQYEKNLQSVAEHSVKPVVLSASSTTQEAVLIVKRIHDLFDEGVAPEDIAVLFRATFHSQALEFELMKQGIEYDYRGGMKFFERAHVKDVIAFLRIMVNFTDEAAWLRVLGLQVGIGDVAASRIFSVMRNAGSLAMALFAPVEKLCGSRVARGWRDIHNILEAMQTAGEKPGMLIRAIAKSSYLEYLEHEYPNYRDRLDDIVQFADFAESYERVSDLLADVTLDDGVLRDPMRAKAKRYEATSRIVLSTIHQAKGLEWDAVFVIHLTNSSFPNRRAILEEGGIEEERRLFYVAVTRAKRYLSLSYPATMGHDAFTLEQPSCFLEEADPSCLDLSLAEDRSSPALIDDGFFDDPVVEADNESEGNTLKNVSERMKSVNKDWRKKNFLGDI